MRAQWCLLVLAGCGASSVNSGQSFAPDWQSDDGKSIAAVEQRLHALPPVPNARIAVGLNDAGLVGVGLDANAHWSHAAKPTSAPIIAGDLVIYGEADRVVALAADSGNRVWSVSNRGLALRGAGNDGTTTALTLAGPKKSLFLAISRSGSELGSAESETALGMPAARGGVAFVPWGNQYVSAIDMKSGDEAGRLLVRAQVSRAQNYGGQLYFGEHVLVRFDEKVRFAATNQASTVALPKLELPGKPTWLESGLVSESAQPNARSKIRVYAAPTLGTDGALTLGGGTIAASYFRVLFGLDAKSGTLRWVRTLPADIVGGAAASSGFYVCDSAGHLSAFDARGGDAPSQATHPADFGSKVRLCSVDAGAQPVPTGSAPPALPVQIASALDALDPDMAEAQRFLLAELGKQDDPTVTKTLIDLSSSPRIPPDLRTEARRLLALRKNGSEFMLTALARHYDFVSGVLLPPPVGPLADALAASNEQRAAPLLAKHLNDPANSADDVARAARALVKLATPAEYEDLRTFFALYRATADDEALVNAVVACAEAILRVGGETGRALVERAAQDPLTQSDVRRDLSEVLAKASAPPAATASAQKPSP